MEIEEPPEFIYTPLGPEADALRFITIEPRLYSMDQVVCTLHGSRISENDGYTALSYMWGPPTDDQFTILLNGAKFFVRASLWTFLFRAREMLPGGRLWIDAICIDQAQTNERNHQVKIMGDIFSNADRVVAWLGEGDFHLRSLFEEIQPWQKAYKLLPNLDIPIRNAPNRQRNLYTHMSLPSELSHLSWVPARLIHFLLLGYWHRTWIVQEILLANRLSFVCGDMSLDYDVLMMEILACSLRTSIDDEAAAFAELSRWHESLKRHSKGTAPLTPLPSSLELLLQRSGPHRSVHGLEMEEIVDMMRQTECLDVRDRIFGSLSLVSMGRTFPVDYNQSATILVLQVLQHFGGNLDLLARLTACLGQSPLAVWDDAHEFLLGDRSNFLWHGTIKPMVAFEILNSCCCEDRARNVHIHHDPWDCLNSESDTQRHIDTSGTSYQGCRRWKDLTLCLQCLGSKSPGLLKSEQIRYSMSDLERISKVSLVFLRGINALWLDASEDEKMFKYSSRHVAFSRPERGVTRYLMETTTFVELLDFPRRHAISKESQKRISRMIAPMGSSTAFLGRFMGGSPPQMKP